MAMTPSTPAGNRFGQVEHVGIDYLPEQARDSRPRNLFAVFTGSNLGWTYAVFGWLAIQLGLPVWGALTSTLVGFLAGVLVIAPATIIGPRTGTNMTVSSGAFFGIRGRFIGTGISLGFALLFAALTVWTSGDALAGVAARLTGAELGDGFLALSYALVVILVIAAALYGHGTIIGIQKFVAPVAAVILLLGFVAFADDFDPSRADTGAYALGGYWQTWALNAVIIFAGPISFAPVVGDYTRRISRRYSDLQVAGALCSGMFLGLMLPAMLGIFTAVSFAEPAGGYLTDLVVAAPAWYVLPIALLALVGGLGQGVLTLYAAGLDLETFVPRFSRVHTTALTAAAATVLLYVGVFVLDAVDSITAATVVLTAVAAPWAMVVAIGSLRCRATGYDPHDLQAYAQRRHGGRYWFSAGWNLPAVVAWLAGSVFGLLSVHTQLYSGPLADSFQGVDLSAVGPMLITAVVYGLAIRFTPDLVDAPGPMASAVQTPVPDAPIQPGVGR